MGTIVDADCKNCDLKGTDLFLGEGMLGLWPFEGRLYGCADCKSLQVAEMVVPLRRLRGVADGREHTSATLPQNAQELAALLVAARRRWPVCDKCAQRMTGPGSRGERPACPSCKGALQVIVRGNWD
jgi:hypothetical protein